MNRRRRILTIVACGFVALLLAAMFSTRSKDSVPISAIDALNAALLRDGFTNVQTLRMVDELAISRLPGVKTIVTTFYPEARKERVNRSYEKSGAKLGIDYTMRRGEAIDIWLSAGAEHSVQMRKIARELAALNPNLAIWLRTNDPPTATKR